MDEQKSGGETEKVDTAPEAPGEKGAKEREVVISVRELVKTFGGRTVLDGVTFDVYRGEALVIMGGSGCGKSTVLLHLVADYRPDDGEIYIFGQDITKLSERDLNKTRLRFGILFQSGALYNSMTVGENVALPLVEHTDLDPNIIDIIVKMKLDLVGLKDFEDLMPSQISGGMRKRVGLARATALDPEILFYDEPTAGLDPIMAGVIDKLMMDLGEKMGVTSVVVTHDMRSAFTIADRIIMLYKGKVVGSGTPDEIQNSADPRIRQFITGSPDGPIPLVQSSSTLAEDLGISVS